MLDILIRNGWVVDGMGTPRRRADVAVTGDRIVEVGLLEGAQATMVLDAQGCVVTPGFVDMHSHADFTLPVLPTADSLVHQGITTAVIGQCGATPVPLLEETRAEVIATEQSEEVPLPYERWSTYRSYLEDLRQMGISVNVVPLVGQGMVREAVMGFTSAAPNEAQLAHMQAEVARAMEEGAIGISTGLIYPPGSYASTEEIIAVTKPVGERQGFYFSHIRGESEMLLEAVAEAIRIGRETGTAVEISHLKAAGRSNWHKAALALELIAQARAEGLDVSADMYPYLAGSSGLVAVLPEWAQEGGKNAIMKRLADPDVRQRMSAAMRSEGFFRFVEWDKVLIAGSPRRRAYEGRTIADLAAEAGKSAHEWVFDALLETELQMSSIAEYAIEDNLRLQLRHQAVMIGTDSHGRATEGALSKGLPHPRTYGTFARILSRYVREQQVISLEEAIHKAAGLPAQKLRWMDRGLIRRGYKADLVVFDPLTIADRATYAAPHQYPVGVHHVIVNGQLVIKDGLHTGARPGEVLSRR